MTHGSGSYIALSVYEGNIQIDGTDSMQYGLSHPRSCWMYTAVSVCTTKLTKLNTKNPDAKMYLCRV